MTASILRIASFDCDIPVPNVYAERGTYSDIFEALLKKATKSDLGVNRRDLHLKFKRYDCVRGDLPRERELEEIDGIIITGSASSAYDDVPWIRSILSFCHKLYHHYPRIKIFGSCFGHQLLSHAIFTPLTPFPHSAVVSKDPAGWEIGIHAITLTPSFLSTFGPVLSNPTSPSHLRLQFIHADHVVLPPSLLTQEGFLSIGRSEHCALQGVWKRGRVLTFQGHAEFDRFVNGETVKAFGKGIWSEGFIGEVLELVGRGEDDAIWAAGAMLKFFLGEDGVDQGVGGCGEKADEESRSSSGREF